MKLFAPILPFVTEEIYQGIFLGKEGYPSIHIAPWPCTNSEWLDAAAEHLGDELVEIATVVRRYKSDRNLPLGTPLLQLQLVSREPQLVSGLQAACSDLSSITRAVQVRIDDQIDPSLDLIKSEGEVQVAVAC